MLRTSLLERNLQINQGWSGFLTFNYGLILLQAKPRKFWFSVLGSDIFYSLHRKLSNVYYSAAFLPLHPMTYIADTASKDTTCYWKLRQISDECWGHRNCCRNFAFSFIFWVFFKVEFSKVVDWQFWRTIIGKKERVAMISQQKLCG